MIEFQAAIVGAAAVSLLFLLLAVFRLRTMDVLDPTAACVC